MVAEVQRRVTARPSVMEPILAAIQAISEQCELELQQLMEAELKGEGGEDTVKESYRRIGVSGLCCNVLLGVPIVSCNSHESSCKVSILFLFVICLFVCKVLCYFLNKMLSNG